MYNIKHICHINAGQNKVFETFSTLEGLRGWWTIQTEGDPTIGGQLEFRFGERFYNKMEVIRFDRGKGATWKVLEGAEDWIGTEISFDLDRHDDQTRIRFVHANWSTHGDFYAQCSFSWAKYLISIRDLVEKGKGDPFNAVRPFD